MNDRHVAKSAAGRVDSERELAIDEPMSGGEPHRASRSLFAIPRAPADGFPASIRGQVIDLADPQVDEQLGPTPNELFIVAGASDLAWSCRGLLRRHGLSERVWVCAAWDTADDRLEISTVHLTLTLPRGADSVVGALEPLFRHFSLLGFEPCRMSTSPSKTELQI
jgi:hypothetical protein